LAESNEMNISGLNAEKTALIRTGYIPLKNKIRIFRISIFLLLLAWCTGFSLLPISPNNEAVLVFQPALKKIYSSFCHQDQEKTIHLGEYFLVCARCSGIYFGAALTALISIFIFLNKEIHLNVRTGIILTLPMLCDVVLFNIGIYSYSITAAFTTGIIFGSAAIIFILSLIENNFFYNSPGLI